MTTLQTQTFDQVVATEAAAVQASSTSLVDFSVGSILLAFAQSVAAIVMWLQGLILQLLTTTRASTSVAGDLDTWMADYGVTRLPAVAATGIVTFARFTPTAPATIPLGAIVQTANGAEQYQVVADTTQAAYSATAGGYVIAAGTASVVATVQALVSGTSGNAAAGAINTLGQTISGVDTVTNAAAFVTGAAAETDVALRARFVNYLGSLAKATSDAVAYAISTVQDGLTFTLTEDYNYAGAVTPGYFYVVVDDGSGSPPSPLITAVASAINATRACGVQFDVFAPVTVTANISVAITAAAGYNLTALKTTVQNVITAFIEAVPVGQSLTWGGLYNAIYTTPGVETLSGLLINSSAADLAATAQQAIIPGTVTVS